jgi:hypothetical protein
MQSAPVVRFGAFELDLRVGELRKHGLKIKLQEQPFQILVMLLEQPKKNPEEEPRKEEPRKKSPEEGTPEEGTQGQPACFLVSHAPKAGIVS